MQRQVDRLISGPTLSEEQQAEVALHVRKAAEETPLTGTWFEVDRARRLIAAFDVAIAEGRGAVAFEGQMIDLPVVDRARKVLDKAHKEMKALALREPIDLGDGWCYGPTASGIRIHRPK
jgi:hypothetical protein